MDAFFLILLLITSIVGVTFIVERGLALRWPKVIPPEIAAAVAAFRGASDTSLLLEICRKNPSPLGRLLLLAYEHRHWPKAENVDTLQTQARHEIMKLERGLVILEIVVGIAPLLGLVGTIYGLILLFGGLGQNLNDSQVAVGAGISLALRATLLGLLTAIPALIAWSYYNKKVESLAVELETLCDQFMRRLYRQAAPDDADVAVKIAKERPAKADKVDKEPVAKAEKHDKPAPEKVEKPVEKHEKPAEKKV